MLRTTFTPWMAYTKTGLCWWTGSRFPTVRTILNGIFAAHGNVVRARIVRDPMGMSLGFGYVAMGDESEAISALDALNGKSLCERILLVVQADAPSLPRRP